jgi:hypothetical protein
MKPEELSHLPDYEKRAHIFMEGVREIREEVLEEHDSILLVMVSDALETWRKSYRSLDKIFSEADVDLTVFGDFTPAAIAERLDRQSTSSSVVEVNASCDLQKPLKKFIKQTLDLAQEQGGRIDGDFIPLSTENLKDMINTTSYKECGFLTCNLFFVFDENLPGSI